MLIRSGGQSLVIPKGQVQEVIRLDQDMLTMMTGRRPYLTLREEIIPFFKLEEDFGAIQKHDHSPIAIIVKHGDMSFGVGITDIMRQQQVVVKPPTKEIMGKQGVMGTTILGDGKPALILDLLNLYVKHLKKESLAAAA